MDFDFRAQPKQTEKLSVFSYVQVDANSCKYVRVQHDRKEDDK